MPGSPLRERHVCAAWQGVLHLPPQRQGPLGTVRSRLSGRWAAGKPCDPVLYEYASSNTKEGAEAMEEVAAEVPRTADDSDSGDDDECVPLRKASAEGGGKEQEQAGRWTAYSCAMEICLSCFELTRRAKPSRQSEMVGKAKCLCFGGGYQPMPQGDRDERASRAKASGSPEKKTARSPARMGGATSYPCKLLSWAADSESAYIAVPRVLEGQGRRDRWAIVHLIRGTGAGMVGRCHLPDCVMKTHVQIASGAPPRDCEHVTAALSAWDSHELRHWAELGLRATPVSLEGCLAHVASGSSRWWCGGLRQCECCGFSKEDVLAESCHASEADDVHGVQSEAATAKRGWFVPAGFVVQRDAPSARELEFGNDAGDALVGRRLLYNWQPPVCVPRHA